MSLSPTTPPRTRWCQGFNVPGHSATETQYSPNAWKRGWKYCRTCDSGYRADRKSKATYGTYGTHTAPVAPRRTRSPLVAPTTPVRFTAEVAEVVGEAPAEETPGVEVVTAPHHDYILDPELSALWDVITNNTLNGKKPAPNVIFLGPAGSGKTDGAKALARRSGLDFTKVDSASMSDPEAWFGTREVISEGGVSVTKYVPSAFVQAIQKPGVIFIDEVNRVDDEHRNVLLPILEPNGVVTNPLTGEMVVRHEHAFVIMAGNRGLMFTGISNIDPAFMTRSYTHEFDYLKLDLEMRVAIEETGASDDDAYVFARFAEDTRAKARTSEDFPPISTREVIMACNLVYGGMNRDLAAKFVILNAASSEGGAESLRQELQNIWNGVRVAVRPGSQPVPTFTDETWVCPVHQRSKVIPAGMSSNGKPYKAFTACPTYGCPHTEDKDQAAAKIPSLYGIGQAPASTQGARLTCSECGHVNPHGVSAFCQGCGATL